MRPRDWATIPFNWAEFDPRHEPPDNDGILLCEDYYLQIEGLVP